MPILKKATPEDVPTIYALAEEIWYDHYPGIVSMEQIEFMLGNFYSHSMLLKVMGEGQIFYLIYEDENDPLGYLATTEREPGKWFMNKFYIKSSLQNKGLGARVLKQWEDFTKPEELKLQVNRKNFKSINFYFRQGFKISEVADFDIGNGYSMDDFIMVKTYPSS